HGGILADTSRENHRADLLRTGIEPIGLVIVNLYPFRAIASRPDARLEQVIEMIDIGGPAMVRAAAKNHARVGVVVDPADYPRIIEEIRQHGELKEETRRTLAIKAFAHTASYDTAIHDELEARLGGQVAAAPGDAPTFPPDLRLDLRLTRELRYGENPHQRGALYAEPGAAPGSLAAARQVHGPELSFNNILDLDSAWRLALEFDRPAAVVVKHSNPCGVATDDAIAAAFEKARQADPVSAFGGVVALNREVDARAAEALASLFLECVIAPHFSDEARGLLERKRKLRLLESAPGGGTFTGFDYRRVTGGLLVQEWDEALAAIADARVVTKRAPSDDERAALEMAWRVSKHVKSNAIVLARGDRTLGIGAGQMSRVDAVRLARMKVIEDPSGAALASDAFFPFRDGLDAAAEAGATAVAQPGGSVKDDEVIAAADEHGLAMVFTGERHFRH
ncbi:MAG: bifunctional phosphoribosylaminoimidazolecarboxamide formyltransferase/IMP cyclohydrolase, partial [Acidobacteria bacterium]|nr:bifunctional phosphoribosylaminoimidazolecarboxamide formyltransferase/IMP cyclohydrolase [Acidobacteriota bacterium]